MAAVNRMRRAILTLCSPHLGKMGRTRPSWYFLQ
jgi:hypothetical protein